MSDALHLLERVRKILQNDQFLIVEAGGYMVSLKGMQKTVGFGIGMGSKDLKNSYRDLLSGFVLVTLFFLMIFGFHLVMVGEWHVNLITRSLMVFATIAPAIILSLILNFIINRRRPIPKTLVFQAVTHSKAFPRRPMSILSTARDQADTTFVLPKDIELIPNQIDCGINVVSMQEMTESSIESYFRFLRVRSKSSSRFYCVNRKRKELPGGEVTTFADYPWSLEDDNFLDGVCPYYRFFLGRTQPNGPSIFGKRVPLINHFDGLVMHRLCHLESSL